MPYKLRGKCVVRSDTGAVIKCHADEEQARKHLAALKVNVQESGQLAALLEGFSADAGPVVLDGRMRPGDRVRVDVKGAESIVGRMVRPSDAKPATHVLVAPEGGGPHVEAAVKSVRHDTPEQQAAERARREAERETERQVLAPPPGERPAPPGASPAVQTERGLRAMGKGSARLQPEAQRQRERHGGKVMEALLEAFNPGEPRGFHGRWLKVAGEIAGHESVSTPVAVSPDVAPPGDRHGGFRVGDTVSYRTPSIVNGKVEGYGPPERRMVVGLQRNGYLRVREAKFGTTVDVHHTRVAAAGSNLDIGKGAGFGRAKKRKVRDGTVVSEGVGLLLEGFAVTPAAPVRPAETPAQSRARAAGMVAQAQTGITAFNALHPRAGHGRFTTKSKTASAKSSTSSKRATRPTAGGPRILTVGTKGTLVRSIQRQLHLPATGTYDAQTQAAIVRYQRQHGLLVDGRVGAQTIASLRGNPNARQVKPGPIPYKTARVANPHKRKPKAPPAPVRLGSGVVV